MRDHDRQPRVTTRDLEQPLVPVVAVVVDLDGLAEVGEHLEQRGDLRVTRQAVRPLAVDLRADDAGRVAPLPDVISGSLAVRRVGDEIADLPLPAELRAQVDGSLVARIEVGRDREDARLDRPDRVVALAEERQQFAVVPVGHVPRERPEVGVDVDRARRKGDRRQFDGLGRQAEQPLGVAAEDGPLRVVRDRRLEDRVERGLHRADRRPGAVEHPLRADLGHRDRDGVEVRHPARLEMEVLEALRGRQVLDRVVVVVADEDDRDAEALGGAPDARRVARRTEDDEQRLAGAGDLAEEVLGGHRVDRCATTLEDPLDPERGDARGERGRPLEVAVRPVDRERGHRNDPLVFLGGLDHLLVA